jgi:hypothetical protein
VIAPHDDGMLTRARAAIHNAFQALALDEHRGPFVPTLWHLPPGPTTTNLEQCWFPGVHINIGGGSDDQIKGGRGDREEIATLTPSSPATRPSPAPAAPWTRTPRSGPSPHASRA